ncbi:hypothetical protein V8E55_010498 [Tylopilus felleus]
MGQPKLHNSAAECALANQIYSKTYYENMKNEARYQHKRSVQVPKQNQAILQCENPPLVTRPALHDMACLEEHLVSIIGQSLTRFLDHVIQGLANVPFPDASIRQLKDVICQVIALRTRGENLQQEILQVEGVGGKFYQVQRVVRNLKDVIFALEDVALLGEIDLEGTMQQHKEGELYYQSRPDL